MSNEEITKEDIYAAIPHREPFLFVDKVLECTDKKILCEKTFTGEEDFFRGHYPGTPLVPGVILCEAVMQAGAIMLSRKMRNEWPITTEDGVIHPGGKIPVVVKMTDIRFRQIVRPGDTVQLLAEPEFNTSRAYQMTGAVLKDGKPAVKLTFVVMVVYGDEDE